MALKIEATTYLDARWRFEDKDTSSAKQIDGQLGVDLHCEEEAEVRMRLEGVQFLLQLDEPRGRQVDVLQHDPLALFHGRIDGLLGLTEAFGGANSDAGKRLLEVCREILHATAWVEALRRE